MIKYLIIGGIYSVANINGVKKTLDESSSKFENAMKVVVWVLGWPGLLGVDIYNAFTKK